MLHTSPKLTSVFEDIFDSKIVYRAEQTGWGHNASAAASQA